MREMDRETFVETEVKPAATRRLVRSLVLEEFAKSENIEVKNEEIQSIYYAALQQMQQSQELKSSSKVQEQAEHAGNGKFDRNEHCQQHLQPAPDGAAEGDRDW